MKPENLALVTKLSWGLCVSRQHSELPKACLKIPSLLSSTLCILSISVICKDVSEGPHGHSWKVDSNEDTSESLSAPVHYVFPLGHLQFCFLSLKGRNQEELSNMVHSSYFP